MKETALQKWAGRNPGRALALWACTAGNLVVGVILISFAGDAINCPLDGSPAVGCDDSYKAGDPVLTVLAWVGFTMLLVGAASLIGAVVWYLVRLKREVDATRR